MSLVITNISQFYSSTQQTIESCTMNFSPLSLLFVRYLAKRSEEPAHILVRCPSPTFRLFLLILYIVSPSFSYYSFPKSCGKNDCPPTCHDLTLLNEFVLFPLPLALLVILYLLAPSCSLFCYIVFSKSHPLPLSISLT